MLVDPSKQRSAYQIEPGEEIYMVVCTCGHKTLSLWDVVRMTTLGTDNVLVRSDLTVHRMDEDGQYVILIPKRFVEKTQ